MARALDAKSGITNAHGLYRAGLGPVPSAGDKGDLYL